MKKKKDNLCKPPGNHKAEMQNRHKIIKKFKNKKLWRTTNIKQQTETQGKIINGDTEQPVNKR